MTLTVTKPGVYELPADEYHADVAVKGGSLSSTWARKLMEPAGPARFIHERRNPQPRKAVFEFGNVAHSVVLGGPEPAVYPDEVLAKNGAVSTKEAKEFGDAARAKGLIPMKQAEMDVVMAMAEAIRANPDAMEALNPEGAMHEVSAYRIDPATGMWVRARFDSLTPGAGIADYKTVAEGNADPSHFARKTAHELGYHQQDAWYLDMAVALDLIPQNGWFKFVLQEKKAPYLVSVVQLSDLYRSFGRDLNRAAIELYAECRRTNTWPGFTGTTIVDPPKWLGDEADARLAADIDAELTAYANSLKAGNAA